MRTAIFNRPSTLRRLLLRIVRKSTAATGSAPILGLKGAGEAQYVSFLHYVTCAASGVSLQLEVDSGHVEAGGAHWLLRFWSV